MWAFHTKLRHTFLCPKKFTYQSRSRGHISDGESLFYLLRSKPRRLSLHRMANAWKRGNFASFSPPLSPSYFSDLVHILLFLENWIYQFDQIMHNIFLRSLGGDQDGQHSGWRLPEREKVVVLLPLLHPHLHHWRRQRPPRQSLQLSLPQKGEPSQTNTYKHGFLLCSIEICPIVHLSYWLPA